MSVTRSTGAATVAVMTSASQPKSVRIWEEFNQGSWAKKNRGLVQFVNVSTETEPGLIRTMGVAQFPTVHVYTRGSNGVTRVALFTGVDSAENLVNRLESLNLGLDPISKADQDVRRTSYPGDVHATEQVQPTPTWPQIQACPPAQSPPMAPTVPVAPTFAPTVSMTGGLVQVPGQNLVVQQAPTQVYLAPPQPPMVYVPQTASAAPMAATMTMAQPVAASPPAGNVFMMAPTMPTATAPQPSVMLAASPGPALTVAAPTSVAVAAPTIGASTGTPTLAAVTNQTLSLPSSGSRTRVRVRGPGFLGSSLARLGERLIQLDAPDRDGPGNHAGGTSQPVPRCRLDNHLHDLERSDRIASGDRHGPRPATGSVPSALSKPSLPAPSSLSILPLSAPPRLPVALASGHDGTLVVPLAPGGGCHARAVHRHACSFRSDFQIKPAPTVIHRSRLCFLRRLVARSGGKERRERGRSELRGRRPRHPPQGRARPSRGCVPIIRAGQLSRSGHFAASMGA